MKLLEREISELTKSAKNQQKVEPGEDFRHERLGELLQEKAELEDKFEGASRLYCEDFTSEAFALLMAKNGGQMAVLAEEGGIVLYNILGRYTKGNATDDMVLCKAKTGSALLVDRIGRGPVSVRHPCGVLLLLVQPDLLRKAFENERLLVGGFLARCFAADARLKMQYETDASTVPADEKIMCEWAAHIRLLVKHFRYAAEPYEIGLEDG